MSNFIFDASHLDLDDGVSAKLTQMRSRLEQEKLPFYELAFTESLINQIKQLKPYLESFSHLVLLGIGGSALGAKALQKSFAQGQDRPNHKGPYLWVMDNVDEISFAQTLEQLMPTETLVLVISKSGATVETIAQYELAKAWMKRWQPATWQEHFFAITDASTGFLRKECNTHGLRSLSLPATLGGRFSIFSAVGMLPAAFLGIDYEAFLRGAKKAQQDFHEHKDVPDIFKVALWTADHIRTNKYSDLIFFNYQSTWSALGDWFRQLWAESLGKNGLGSTPIPALGCTDQHSMLQLFLGGPSNKSCLFLLPEVFPENAKEQGVIEQFDGIFPAIMNINLDKDNPYSYLQNLRLSQLLEAEAFATRQTLINKGIPLISVQSPSDEEAFGALLWELGMITVLTGWLLDIDPLNQPAVEDGKILTLEYLEKYSK